MEGFENQNNNPDNIENGFHAKSKEDIIQDEIIREEKPVEAEPIKHEYYSYTPDAKPQQSFNYAKPKKEKKMRSYGLGTVIIASVLAAVIGAASGIGVVITKKIVSNTVLPSISEEDKEETKTPQVGGATDTVIDSNALSSTAQSVADKASSSVVGIRTTTSVTSFFGGDSESTGEGSGVVYTADGYIVTNYHVISGALASSKNSKIEVFFDNCNTDSYKAEVIGYNISTDLAVIKIDANNLTAVSFGNSDNIKIGQYVITIGAPGGLEFMGSVTYGIISGLDRVVSSNSGIGLIQTDAAINPGNSGGALLDSEARLIGINSSKIVSEEFEGMGFAIPVNKVVEVCNSIIENKDNSEAYVGITISEKYTSEVLSYYGFPSGAVVSSVADGSPADDTGIKRGDIITEFNGVKVTEFKVYYEALANCKSGEKVPLKVYRNGRTYSAEIKIMNDNVTK